ncbi:MAG: putative rhamnosyl transferase [Weeksellaceae bacterium]|nr:putative rhamnosyl transferase [Bacteroidota bacterium]MCG2779520.1 putative rhamnosyl transferase [Weeksellaceae bacterium]
METFKHIISTRFNVPTEIWKTTRTGKKPLSDEWLEDRFEIFRQYCFPSFKNQSQKNFVWLVFFDILTPQKYREIISDIREECEQFHPVFVHDFQEMSTRLLEIIPQYFDHKTEYVITTDIDNDDMIHRSFVAEVQKNFKPVHNLAIDLRLGFQLTKTGGNKGVANYYYQVANPFVSLVEKISDFRTVTKENHLHYRNYPNIVSEDTSPLFIQFIHENNLMNETFQNSKRISKINYSDFGISKENELLLSDMTTFVFNTKRLLKNALKILSKRHQ